MTEHVHEWAVDHQILPDVVEGTDIHYGECFAYCGCGAELRCHEIQSRLNATERLKKNPIMRHVMILFPSVADILEGNDENERR